MCIDSVLNERAGLIFILTSKKFSIQTFEFFDFFFLCDFCDLILKMDGVDKLGVILFTNFLLEFARVFFPTECGFWIINT